MLLFVVTKHGISFIYTHYILIVLVQLFVSYRVSFVNRITTRRISSSFMGFTQLNKGNKKITEPRAILQRESQNS